MFLDELLARRLVILSGKGGVGKSVVGRPLALAARERGTRVLLVEVDAPPLRGRALPGRRAGRARETREVLPGLFTVNLQPRAVMDEYVREMVRVELLARKILESPVYHRFFAAAPGLQELMVLGKIMVLEEERERLVAPAALRPRDRRRAGHRPRALLPQGAAGRRPPPSPWVRWAHNARRILEMLRDPARTASASWPSPRRWRWWRRSSSIAWPRRRSASSRAAFILNACHERRFTAAQEAEVLRLGAAERLAAASPRGVPLSSRARGRPPPHPAPQAHAVLPAAAAAGAATCRS